MKLCVSDDHAGLKAARAAVFPFAAWQRCPFHLQQNAGHYGPPRSRKKPIAAGIRAIFDAPDEVEAKRLIERFIRTDKTKAPQLAEWAEAALPEGPTVVALPRRHRKRLRTNTSIEVVNREIKRRTSVAPLFLNEASYLRPVATVTMEISQDWQAGRRYLNMSDNE